ncbi:hypothetical protein ACFOND_10020 [Reinekea marina]|uniref:Uncharacterized protein n=2 Tax=Reinekea marina TaxID=1310421 RepID=A0ABV7WRY6_9GAMM
MFKLFTPKSFKHMALSQPYLKLEPVNDIWKVYWKGGFISETDSWNNLRLQAPDNLYSIATGPSISDQQFNNLDGGQCVLVNGAVQLVLDNKISTPLAVMVEDARFIYERFEMLLALPKGTRLCLVASAMHALGVVAGVEGLKHFNLMLIDGFETPYGSPKRSVASAPVNSYRKSSNAKLSLDLNEGHFGCGTVMYCGIQMAFHLRVKELYLVGFDLTNFDQPRFYETKDNAAWTGLQNAYEARILPALELTMQTAEEFNMQVYNCSHTSIIPRSLIPYSDCLTK